MQQSYVRKFPLYMAEASAGTAGILLGVFVWFYTNHKGWAAKAKSVVNNPAFFPHIVAVGLILLGIMLILKSRTTRKDSMITVNILSFALILGWMLYVLLMKRLGFILSSVLVMVYTCVLWGIRSKRTIALISVLTPVVIYLIMVRILHVKFPTLF